MRKEIKPITRIVALERSCVRSTSRSSLGLCSALRLGLRPRPHLIVCALAILVFALVPHLFAADSRFADAAEKSDRATIRTLLKQHVDVNAPQVDGMTALHW